MLPAMLPPIATGVSDFTKLRERGALYVDKTAFVTDVLSSPTDVTLFCRPRRFGKTLNMTTLRAFVEPGPPGVRALFDGLAIAHAGELVWRHFQAHPVIWLSFKDVKARTWAEASVSIAELIGMEARRHAPRVDPTLTEEDARTFGHMRRDDQLTTAHHGALLRLSQWIHGAHGQKPIVLIDEYDTPLHTAYEYGYYDEAVTFFRTFLGGGLKDNVYLDRAVLTGILRVAKESIFSGLNNLEVHTVLSRQHGDAFGFTEDEVRALLDQAEVPADVAAGMRQFYNGYRIGGFDLYNPWSVTQFFRDLPHRLASYWVGTSDNALVRQLLIERGTVDGPTLEAILRGEAVSVLIDEHLTLRDAESRPEALLSLLVMSGYLRVDAASPEGTRLRATVRAPNTEVRLALADLAERTVTSALREPVDPLAASLLTGDTEGFGRRLQFLVETALSFHTTGGRHPERVYQAFVAGLLVGMEKTHRVETDPESGFGRADVLVLPKRAGLPGVAMELKLGGPEALDAAMAQLRDRDYAAKLRQAGATPIRLLAAAFDGKHVVVRFSEE